MPWRALPMNKEAVEKLIYDNQQRIDGLYTDLDRIIDEIAKAKEKQREYILALETLNQVNNN